MKNDSTPQVSTGAPSPSVGRSDLLDQIEIFLFGRRFGNKAGAKHGPHTLRVPECLWEMAPTGDYYALTFTIPTAPWFLNRWAQTVILGIRYRRVGSNDPSSATADPNA